MTCAMGYYTNSPAAGETVTIHPVLSTRFFYPVTNSTRFVHPVVSLAHNRQFAKPLELLIFVELKKFKFEPVGAHLGLI